MAVRTAPGGPLSAAATIAWTALTVVVFETSRRALSGRRPHPLVSPFFLTVAAVAVGAALTGTDATEVRDAGRPLTLLLAPATVALGVRAAHVRADLRRNLRPLVLAVVAGGAVASGLAVGIAALLDGPGPLRIALSAKSITTPIALAVSEPAGAEPSLVAGVVVVTGVLGAALVPWLLGRLGVTDPQALGLATGTVAHAIGTAEVARHHVRAGTMSGVALTVNGVGTAVWLPVALAVSAG